MRKYIEAMRINVFDKDVFEIARQLPDRMPEPFIALEEHDRTGVLPINFTLDPSLYEAFKEYCEKHGREISKTLKSSMEKKLKTANI